MLADAKRKIEYLRMQLLLLRNKKPGGTSGEKGIEVMAMWSQFFFFIFVYLVVLAYVSCCCISQYGVNILAIAFNYHVF